MTEQSPSSDRSAARDVERHTYDVVVIGAGGSGLRAAIAAHEAGSKVALVCKSLLGKAHTVMAEGGAAAALGNLWPDDNWQVHFRDTMRGGKMLNHWRMAQLHAQEAPERVLELEDWGALFDRTKDGLISQRDFGGHRYARLAHVGDRTGLELIRTLQQHTVALGVDVFMECTVTRLLTGDDGVSGAFGYWRESGRFVAWQAPSVVLATGGGGKTHKGTSNTLGGNGGGHRRDRQDLQGHLELLGVHRRRPLAGDAGRGVAGQHGVRPVPPDRDGLAAVGARAAGHRERPRRRRSAEELGRQPVHVRLHPRLLPQGDRGDRGGGRPLVRGQEEQPAPAGAAAA